MAVKAKETLELVDAIFKIVLLSVEQFKDGFQISDLPALLLKASSDPVILEGIKGSSYITDELKDSSSAELFLVLEKSLAFSRDVYKALKG